LAIDRYGTKYHTAQLNFPTMRLEPLAPHWREMILWNVPYCSASFSGAPVSEYVFLVWQKRKKVKHALSRSRWRPWVDQDFIRERKGKI